jgi:hypothetical protein
MHMATSMFIHCMCVISGYSAEHSNITGVCVQMEKKKSGGTGF